VQQHFKTFRFMLVAGLILFGLFALSGDSANARTPAPTRTPTPDPKAPVFTATGPDDPILPTVSARAKEIYALGQKLGNDPRAFSKIGDCNSALPLFLSNFDNPESYRLGPHTYLQPVLAHFAGSFVRDSVAARDGFSTSSLFAVIQNDPARCFASESPLNCELRLQRPSFAFVGLGTNGNWQTDEAFERGLRRILDLTIQRGIVPILSTKADDMEGGARFNFIISKLAREYDVPLWNFWKAAKALPDFGLAYTYHLSWARPYFDDPKTLQTGWGVRNLTALQALDVVWRGVTGQPPAQPTPSPTGAPAVRPTSTPDAQPTATRPARPRPGPAGR
jgi:hypothetical protein